MLYVRVNYGINIGSWVFMGILLACVGKDLRTRFSALMPLDGPQKSEASSAEENELHYQAKPSKAAIQGVPSTLARRVSKKFRRFSLLRQIIYAIIIIAVLCAIAAIIPNGTSVSVPEPGEYYLIGDIFNWILFVTAGLALWYAWIPFSLSANASISRKLAESSDSDDDESQSLQSSSNLPRTRFESGAINE